MNKFILSLILFALKVNSLNINIVQVLEYPEPSLQVTTWPSNDWVGINVSVAWAKSPLMKVGLWLDKYIDLRIISQIKCLAVTFHCTVNNLESSACLRFLVMALHF